MPNLNQQRIMATAEYLADVLAAHPDMMGETMASLQCHQAAAVTDLLVACGHPVAAGLLMEAHVKSDDVEDVCREG